MARMVKRLSKLDIDEISLVDKPANQHGLVAIAKRDEESTMSAQPLFDVEGYEVDPSALDPGQYVYDEAGNEYVNVVDDVDDDDDDQVSEFVDEYDDEDDEVGKAYGPLPKNAYVQRAGRAVRGADYKQVGVEARRLGREGAERGRRAGRKARNLSTAAGMQYRALPEGGRTGLRYGSTAATGAAAGYEGGRRRRGGVEKSYGESVLEQLSKAYSDDDRDSVVSKAIDDLAYENQRLVSKAEQVEQQMAEMREQQEYGEFVELAKSYGYAPGEVEEVADLMYDVALNSPEQLPMLDRILTSQSNIAKSMLVEQGTYGNYESDALAQVYSMADQAVSKTDGQITTEQAITELFSANPGLYDEYESDNRF